MSNRIYIVTNTAADPVTHRLVRAANVAQARNFVARDQFTVDVAGQQSLIDLIQKGVAVEDATEKSAA